MRANIKFLWLSYNVLLLVISQIIESHTIYTLIETM